MSRRVMLEGGPRHGEEYTVADTLDHLEVPTKWLSVGEILCGPEVDTTVYTRDLNNPAVFRHQA